MKKILSLMLVGMALVCSLSSCSDENSIPDVNFKVDFSGGVVDPSTGTIYVVQGETLKINSVTVTNVESDKAAAVTFVEYYWDYGLLGTSSIMPYEFTIITTEGTALGGHELTLRAGVVAVGKEPAIAVLGYNVEVVQDAADIPVENPSTSLTVRTGLQAE